MDCSRGSQQLAIGTDIDLPLSVVCEFATGEHALLIEVNRTWRAGAETVEHPFGTIKARMGATHFLMKTLPRVAAEMALHVLAYNMTRVMNIMGTKPLIAAMRA